MKYLKYFTVLVAFFPFQLSGQIQRIEGWVYSPEKAPLNYASIQVLNKEAGTVSGNDGYFLLTGQFDSTDNLRISRIGYETVNISIGQVLASHGKIFLKTDIITSQTILVKGGIGETGITPLTFSKIDHAAIIQTHINQDIPELLSYQPSVTFYSENGNGIGYNYLSIRGFDQRRISFSINGIPQNDPEDHNVYWLDFPDLLESTELIQIQRGAGSGITGYPAVGGSINLITATLPDKPRLDLSSSFGSFNTRKYSMQFSSGLVAGKYSFYAKLSQTLSSGYRNSSWTDFKSFHFSAVRYDSLLTTQLNIYGGPVADGLAYTGLPKFAVKNKDLRRANYSYWESDENKYNYTLERRPDEIENFSQPHFELLNEWKVSGKITFNNALFLVLGNGFFDYDGSWADTNYFRISGEFGFHPSQNPGNALIRAMVENKQWGWIPRVSISHDDGMLIIGGELRIHRSLHWGSINYAEGIPAGVTKDYRYYSYNGGKDILNLFINENYKVNEKINLLFETQAAYFRYKIFSELFLKNDFNIDNLFFNPRFGINYKITGNLASYFSFAKISREPRLKNYYDAAESSGGAVPQFRIDSSGRYDFSNPLVKPETMYDFELGSSYSTDGSHLSLNLYYMLFNDEIVKQGQIDRFGQPVTGNMERTIHYGAEMSASARLNEYIDLIVNGSLSKNYISRGEAFVSTGDPAKPLRIDLSSNRISGFPDITFNTIIKYSRDNFLLQASIKYVGEFRTDNYDNKLDEYRLTAPQIAGYSDNKVDPYFVSNIYASYSLNLEPVSKELQIFLQINNVFDNLYAAYGIGGEFFPAAERNFNFGVKLSM